MMSTDPRGSLVLRLLTDAEQGREVSGDLVLELYTELRRLAAARLMHPPGSGPLQTLQPTALVHEAFIRLLGKEANAYESRRHFFYAAARAMQDIMVEQARRKARRRRLGAAQASDPETESEPEIAAPHDMLALSQALEHLQSADPRKAELVRLRFFAGLTMSQAAQVMDVSVPTLEREWRLARSILQVQLKNEVRDS